MPSSRGRRRAQPPRAAAPARCSYTERGQRCVRNGSRSSENEPALCQAHRVILQDVARNDERKPFRAVTDIFENLMSGRRITQEQVVNAYGEVNDLFQGMGGIGGNIAQGWHPPVGPRPGQGSGGPPPPRTDHAPWERGHQNESPPPFVDEETRIERIRARALLGFGPAELVTAESLKKRHRELSMKHHPDRGGSVAKMQAINAAVDTIAASL